jgi:MFS family permease
MRPPTTTGPSPAARKREVMSISRASLWRSPGFARLWAGQTVSLLGSQIGTSALRFTALLVLAATPAEMVWLSMASLLPVLLLSLPVGLIVDRVRRRPLLILADLLRAALIAAIPAAYLLGALRIELLYVTVALVGVGTILFDSAYHAFIPAVVPPDRLIDANSRLSASDSLAEVGGPPLGGLLVQALSAPLVLLLDAASFLLSAAALWGVRANEPALEPATSVDLWSEALDGLRALWGDGRLRAILLVEVTRGLAGGMIGPVIDVFMLRDLGLSPAIIGLTVGVGGAAALGGALLAGGLVRRLGLGRTMAGALALSGVATLLIPLAGGPYALGLVLLSQLSDVAHTVYGINEVSLRQRIVPDMLLGRVGAAMRLAGTAALLVGMLLAGGLLPLVAVRGVLLGGALIAALSAFWVMVSPLRGQRDLSGGI